MNWESLNDFFNMGGYAYYVWASYGVTALLMVLEVVLLARRKRSLLQRLARITRMNQRVER